MIKMKLLMKISMLLLIPMGNLIGFSNKLGQYSAPNKAILTPTTSATLTGVKIYVKEDNDQINVRSGPKTTYSKIGELVARAEVQAYGISIGQDWIQVEFPEGNSGAGWVYAPLVIFIEGNYETLPIVSAPPTATPETSPTIDPTLAAQFIVDVPATKLPTFTPPPPLVISTFPPPVEMNNNQVPMGAVIASIFLVGSAVGILSLFRNKKSR